MNAPHNMLQPSPWVQRWAELLPKSASVLDVACGSGRHTRWLAQRGCHVTAVDRDNEAVAGLRELAEVKIADIEEGPGPFTGRMFDAVVVTNYLWRPLLPTLVGSVAPGGMLIYETFVVGHETVGRPSRPDFLLRPGELLEAVTPRLRVVAYEDGFLREPDRFVQHIAAVHELSANRSPVRYPL